MSNITYLRVSFVLQVEHEKQLTHQALLRADTTEGITLKKEIMNIQLYLNILSKLLKITILYMGYITMTLTIAFNHAVAMIAHVTKELHNRKLARFDVYRAQILFDKPMRG